MDTLLTPFAEFLVHDHQFNLIFTTIRVLFLFVSAVFFDGIGVTRQIRNFGGAELHFFAFDPVVLHSKLVVLVQDVGLFSRHIEVI